MGTADRAAREIHGKIVYFGAPGSGKSATLAFIQRKLKREHRGEMKKLTTRDGAASYETLPVQLGAVRSYTTSIQIFTTPGSASAAGLRRQILDRVDGIVFVADLRPERHDATAAALAELRQHLQAHGRKLEDVPLVVRAATATRPTRTRSRSCTASSGCAPCRASRRAPTRARACCRR
jgi:signal recognition particle receptor subunit beta